MKISKQSTSIKTKIMLSTILPTIFSFLLICVVIFTSLSRTLYENASSELTQITSKHSAFFQSKVNSAMNYLTVITDVLASEAGTDRADRESMQRTLYGIFENYGDIDGSSVYFEENMYDGRDAEYKGTHYGTPTSGKIAFYYYDKEGDTVYLPEALENDIEFTLPHYTLARDSGMPIYTKPEIHVIDGIPIPMFTISHPIHNNKGEFCGVVTVDLFLDDIYEQLTREKTYKSGYFVVSNDRNEILYSPIIADIGKKWEEVPSRYTLASNQIETGIREAVSILDNTASLVALEIIYIPSLGSHFYISLAAPLGEINMSARYLMVAMGVFSLIVIGLITVLLYYAISKISDPIKEITKSANLIAQGDYCVRITEDYKDEFALVKNAINTMAENIEKHIAESETSLKTLEHVLNGLDSLIYVTIPDTGEILFVNEKMKELFGVQGSGIGQICYKTFREGHDAKCSFCPCYKLDEDPSAVIIWEDYSTKTDRHYRNISSYMDWIDGNQVYLQHIVDITDLKKIMEEKLKAESDAFEMKHEKERAEAAAQAKNDFLAKMSHEIRTPMNAVMGMTELILRKELPQDVFENALMIRSASNNLLSIINDILDFSKIESGKFEIVEAEYLLPSLINDVISVIRIRMVDKPVLFDVYIDSEIPHCLIGDEIRIRQMLINLLSNAVKYTQEGHISFEISGELKDGEVMLVVDVADSGIGIKEEDIGKLFGDFVQIDTVTNKNVEGTGLGLAITRNLCRIMGGEISVRSEYGRGSVFTLTLPQKFNEYKPFAAVDDAENKTVLLYETRPRYLNSVARTLSSLGVRHEIVSTIPEVFERLSEFGYLFISSYAYGSISPTLSQLASPPRLVLLSDVTEVYKPKDAINLALPSHALNIANILNDVTEDLSKMTSSGASFTAPDAKILIVDDVMANLKVGEGLLLPYNMQVTICLSGREALNLVEKNDYDLVFMDHMMPEMDGIETTRRIRELGEKYEKLPIIALTANAVSGVREMFVQNGMNDFLAKPIETAKLDAILDKWIPKEKRSKRTDSEIADEKSALVDMLSGVSEVSVNKALSVLGGSVSMYERIFKLSVRLMPENIERLNALIDTDLPNYSIEVHGIKGVLNNIGAYGLGSKALELEQLSRAGDIDTCKVLHSVFVQRLTNFSDLANDLVSQTEIDEKTEGDISVLAEVLERLRGASEFYDSALALDIMAELENASFGSEIDDMLSELTGAFEGFDFDTADNIMGNIADRLG